LPAEWIKASRFKHNRLAQVKRGSAILCPKNNTYVFRNGYSAESGDSRYEQEQVRDK